MVNFVRYFLKITFKETNVQDFCTLVKKNKVFNKKMERINPQIVMTSESWNDKSSQFSFLCAFASFEFYTIIRKQVLRMKKSIVLNSKKEKKKNSERTWPREYSTMPVLPSRSSHSCDVSFLILVLSSVEWESR